MIPAPSSPNESARLKALRELDILDTLEEQSYNDLTQLASIICDCPISFISLVDKDRQWFKSRLGLADTETPREISFCAHAILQESLLVVPDTRLDARFSGNPFVTTGKLLFYAGMPLDLGENLRVGTLCVADSKPRVLTEEQSQALEAIGRQVVTLLHLRRHIKQQEQLAHAKSEFVAMVSHELRTPLTAIFGSLRLLQESEVKEDPAMVTRLLDTSVASTERLMSIVNDILDLTKFESGSFKIIKQPHNLKDTLQMSMDELASYAAKCQVTLELTCQLTQPTLSFDRDRIIQVMNNLISNAAKFSPAGSVVKVSAIEESDSVVISVADPGPGIPAQALEGIFDKFSKLDVVTSKKLPGTGLGLAICKTIVELHEGEIWAQSRLGHGTTFSFRLPRAAS